jgi:DNA repair exonuclease SbcCD ATPase subunit/DNA repair exonuclease SbcCD nuclease subunit
LKFAHIADTHIRNLKYHYEYRKVFAKMYEILKEEKVDAIVHCGDLAHTKTQLSPEFFDMAQKFLKSLSDIAPTYMIPGNHDGNLKNSSRQDAITPVVEALNHPNLHFLKDSGECIVNDDFCFNVLSVFDDERWVQPSNPDMINIALHHGSISGCKTDLNWTMEYGENDISIFDGHDYTFLGDIHKTNQILDEAGKIRYCGSTVQQNHGETNDKGFLIWDIQDKENYTCKHVSVENPKPFVTVTLTPKGRLPNKLKVPENARLRVVTNSNVPLDAIRKALDVAKVRFKPESITFLNRASGERGSVEELTKNFMKEDLRDIGVQEKFIRKYLTDYNPDEEVLEKVLEYNKKYNTIIEEGEDVIRNVNWKIKSLEWDNLFNYGEKNRINFDKLNGIVGVFGKNFSGKSSIVDGLLYTLYNTTSKNNRKNLHVINQNKDSCLGRVNISIGEKDYVVERTSEKYIKKLKGEETLEAKTNIDFYKDCSVTGENESLNGLSRNGTDKNIRKVFGAVDDFLLTSMASQLDSLSFIKEGSTRRKEILAKFLDLEIFDKKFRLAKEDATDLRGALKRLEEKEFDDDIKEISEQVAQNEKDTTSKKRKRNKLQKLLKSSKVDLEELDSKIESIPAEIIDVNKVNRQINSMKGQIVSLTSGNNLNNKAIEEKTAYLQKVQTFKSSFDIEDLKNKKEISTIKSAELESIINDINLETNNLNTVKKKVSLLKEVPCGPEFSHCKFIKDAYNAKNKIDIVQAAIDRLNEQSTVLEKEVESLGPKKLDEYIEKYHMISKKEQEAQTTITKCSLIIEKNNNQIMSLQMELGSFSQKLVEYEQNKEAIENLESLISNRIEVQEKIGQHERNLNICEEELLVLYKIHGSLEQQFENLQDQKEELVTLREDYAAYDLFMRCMHSNGIPYDIVKKSLPVLNEEIAKILTNIVNFEVFFDTDGNKLEIFIKHPRFEPRPIELGSGAEKTISAMAIRLALLGVSNLPKPDLFILDEPGTALDEENMEGFVRILTDMIKSSFKTVLLISHLDSLKDCVDTTIEIEREDGFARINC